MYIYLHTYMYIPCVYIAFISVPYARPKCPKCPQLVTQHVLSTHCMDIEMSVSAYIHIVHSQVGYVVWSNYGRCLDD